VAGREARAYSACGFSHERIGADLRLRKSGATEATRKLELSLVWNTHLHEASSCRSTTGV
jgi:hypothetical protein